MSTINKPILSCRHVGKSYDNFVALKDVSLSIQESEKIGLVGANGSGKSTLLKIIASITERDEGGITTKKDIAIGYIPQTFTAHKNASVNDFLSEAINKSRGVLPGILPLLSRIGFKETILERKMRDLSGGEKTKIAMLRIIISPYDLFLLDEPTNNLDMNALMILEDFIQKSAKAFIIVSHDRALLDKTVNKIIEIDAISKKSIVYDGNFTDYLNQKKKRIEKEWATYTDSTEKITETQKSINKKESWVRKLEAERNSLRTMNKKEKEKPVAAALRDKEAKMGRRARIIKERLQKFKEEKAPEKPVHLLPLHVRFEVDERSGDKVFNLEGVKKNLPEKNIGPIDMRISYGEAQLYYFRRTDKPP